MPQRTIFQPANRKIRSFVGIFFCGLLIKVYAKARRLADMGHAIFDLEILFENFPALLTTEANKLLNAKIGRPGVQVKMCRDADW